MTRPNFPAASKCKSCGAFIHWATSEKTGKAIPVDDWPPPQGMAANLALYLRGGELVATAYDSQARARGCTPRVAHWATCPDAKSWRRES